MFGDSWFAVMLCVAALSGVVVGQIVAIMFFMAVVAATQRRTIQLLRQCQPVAPVRTPETEGGARSVRFGPGARPSTGKLIQDWHRANSPDMPTQPHPVVGKNGMHP